MRRKNRKWRCFPPPQSPWQASLGWVLTAATLIESVLAAVVFHFQHPILIGVLVASSVPAIFPVRAALRAPFLQIEDGALVLAAPWVRPGSPASIPVEALDLDRAAVVRIDDRPDLQVAAGQRGGSVASGDGSSGSIAGLFALANGRQAHVMLSPKHPALYLPTDSGPVLLLSLRQPEQLLAELRARTVSGDAAA